MSPFRAALAYLRYPPVILAVFLILVIHLEFQHATVSDYLGYDQSLLARLASHARPLPFVAYGEAPYGPVGLRDDFYFFPIPSADGKTLAIVSYYKFRGEKVWPLSYGAELWCRGNEDGDWSLAQVKRDQLDPHEYILVLECQASGDFATLQLRTPGSTSKVVMVPLQSIRPAKPKASSGPHIVAMTMMGSWDSKLPSWIEYQVLRGVQEVYIYDNTIDNRDTTLLNGLKPYIDSGLVIVVPFHHILLNSYAPSWVQQQLLAVNHVVRSMDGYADWLLLCDVDEYPTFTPIANISSTNLTTFSYSDHLDAAMKADPNIGEFSMINCFTSLIPYEAPIEPSIVVDNGTTYTVMPKPTAVHKPTIPSLPPSLSIPNFGGISLFPQKAHRFAQCNGHTYRSKVFVRPSYVTVESIHHTPAGNGTDNVQTPDTGLWLMHLSDHNNEIKGAQIDLDMSEVSRDVTEALLARYEGSSVALKII